MERSLRIAVVLLLGAMAPAQDWFAEQNAHRARLAVLRTRVTAGDASVLDELITVLKADTYPSIRHEAVELLGEMHGPRVFEALRDALTRDQQARTKKRIVASFGTCGDARAFELLVELLQQPDVRADAAGALGALADPRGFGALAALWQRLPEDAEVQRQAAVSLLKLDEKRAQPMLLARLARDPRASEPLARALKDRKDPEVRRTFRALLGASESRQRNAAFDALLESLPLQGGDDEDAKALIGYWERLQGADGHRREWVAFTLGWTRSKAAAQWTCATLVKEKDHATKARLLEALGRLGEPRAIASLAPFLYERPERVLTCSVRFAPEYVPLQEVAAWSITMLRDGHGSPPAQWNPWGYSPDVSVGDSESVRAWWEAHREDPRWSFPR